MQSTVRERFWFEAGVMSVCGILAVLTVIWPDWIEALTGFNPDNQIGSFEWMIVAGLFVVCVLAGFAACAELRRPGLSRSWSLETLPDDGTPGCC